MQSNPIRWAFLMVACATGVLLAGCGLSPNAPTLDGSSASAGGEIAVLAVSPDGSVDYDSVGTGGELDSLMIDSLRSDSSCALKVTGEVGPLGGVLRAGRFVLNFPPDALPKPATVTMSLPDSTLMLCDLDISPVSMNDFAIPVELSLDIRGLSVSPSELSIYWYDPTPGRWVDMHATPDLTGQAVTESLTHFSTYAGGKAGW